MARLTSFPMRSANARGPIGWLAPSIMHLSMSSADAMPSAKIPTASLIIGMRMRLTTKPGASFTSTGCLPIEVARSTMHFVTSSLVSCPLMTSTNAILSAGLKKCMPMNCAGRVVQAAISVIESDDELVAKIASGLQILSSSANTSFLRAISSDAASMTRSASLNVA